MKNDILAKITAHQQAIRRMKELKADLQAAERVEKSAWHALVKVISPVAISQVRDKNLSEQVLTQVLSVFKQSEDHYLVEVGFFREDDILPSSVEKTVVDLS